MMVILATISSYNTKGSQKYEYKINTKYYTGNLKLPIKSYFSNSKKLISTKLH